MIITSFLGAQAAHNPRWLVQRRAKYVLHYAAVDRAQVAEYESFFAKGVAAHEAFFQRAYPKRFDVYVHPDRDSFDTALQKRFHEPNFRSACWLSGVGWSDGIDVLAPGRWGDGGACEGRYTTYADKEKTQKFITHELTHVLHGQTNRNHRPDLNLSSSRLRPKFT